MHLQTILALAASLLHITLALPQIPVVPLGTCAYAGQFICTSPTTFAICDASLMGIIQSLAPGDPRCGGAADAGYKVGTGIQPKVVPTTLAPTPGPPPPGPHGSTHSGGN
ncbi:hypothetical protein H2200_010868 [Cladophialophora chaetospira]|uniref:Uncharacterized protein n=1 Tax=Cladophialophora chaetospira TaxID=386627 RepID=A0AA38X0X8_9EURO|nr:hypothetical protein H2200_010868 [Cladophialophora chaetospira]